MATLTTTPETGEAIQKLMMQSDLLLLMTGPDGLRNIDEDHADRLLGYCLALGVSATRCLAPELAQPDDEFQVCSEAELAAVRARAEARYATLLA
jgi:hypothetical protein